MKSVLCALYVLCGQSIFSQNLIMVPDRSAEQAAAARAAEIAAQREAIIHAPPTDPYRIFTNKLFKVNQGRGWYRIWGQVNRHDADGLLINGSVATETNDWSGTFLLVNFPYQGADGDVLAFAKSWYAREDGFTSNSPVYHRFDYGQVWKQGMPIPGRTPMAGPVKLGTNAP